MNGQINKGNIGWYLLQAQEGNLNVQEMDALCSFLEAHSERIPETEFLLSASDEATSGKSFSYLKKEDFELGAFDMLAVSVLEGERHEHDLNEVTSQRADLQQQWRAFQHTLLKAETALMPNKDTLYHERAQYLWIRYAAAACLAALFLGMGWMVFQSGGESQQLVNVQPLPVDEAVPQVKPQTSISFADDAAPLGVTLPKIEEIIHDTFEIREIPKRQEFFIERLEPIKLLQLETKEPLLLMAQNMSHPFIEEELNSVESASLSEDTNKWPRVLRIIMPGKSKPQFTSDLDWFDLLANAGNQGLDQISKGRIEFSYQPDRDNGPEAFLKIGNFSISRSIASN